MILLIFVKRLRAAGALCAFLALFLTSYHAALTEDYGILDDYNDLTFRTRNADIRKPSDRRGPSAGRRLEAPRLFTGD